MNRVHVGGLPQPMNLSVGEDPHGPCTSSRPPSALANPLIQDDEVSKYPDTTLTSIYCTIAVIIIVLIF